MRLLLFSDLHCDLEAAERLVGFAAQADVVIGAGDFATVHRGLPRTIAALSRIAPPTVLVPGNNETEDALRAAAESWRAATVLHGQAVEISGTTFFGLGGGVPVTPWDWSFDLDEGQATDLLAACPEGAVLAVHSPPHGHVDRDSGRAHLGSRAILAAVEAKRPPLVVCGHIHACWGQESRAGESVVINAGPGGVLWELPPVRP